MTGSPTSTSVCIVQSGLYASLGPLLSFSIFSYALNVCRVPPLNARAGVTHVDQFTQLSSQVLLIIPPPSMLLMGTVATSTMAVLLLLPFLAFAALGVASALVSFRPGRACITPAKPSFRSPLRIPKMYTFNYSTAFWISRRCE